MDISDNTFKKVLVNKTIIVLGDSKVGKTSFVQRYANDFYQEKYTETIGVDYYNKKIKTTNETYSLHIWDTNGREYEKIYLNPQIYKINSLYIIMCSFDNYESYENIDNWFDFILNISNNQNKSFISSIPIILLVNKNDLNNDKKIFNFTDVFKKMEYLRLDILIFPFSAKNDNYKDLFKYIDIIIKEKSQNAKKALYSIQNKISKSNDNLKSDSSLNKTSKSSFKIRKTNSFINDRDKKNQKSCC